MLTAFGPAGRAISSLLCPLLLAGCTFGRELTTIHVDDHDVFVPAFRASYQIVPEEAETLRDLVFAPPHPEGTTPEASSKADEVEGLASIDFDFAYGQGTSSQDLAFRELASFDDVDFGGPVHVRYSYELSLFSLALRGGARVPGIIDFEGLLGAGWTSLDLVAKSHDARAHDVVHDAGFLFGGKITGHPLRWLAVYAKGSNLVAEGLDGLADGELGFALEPLGGLSVFAGWRWWDYDEENEIGGSDIELDVSGPTCGLELVF